MKGTELLWPTPIFCNSRIENYTKIQTELKSTVEKIDFKMKEEWGKTHYLSDVSFKKNIIEEYNLEYFKKGLESALREYSESLNFFSLYTIRDSWLALYKNGNYSPLHGHGNTHISGVYYFKTNGKDGNFYLECPVPQFECVSCYDGCGYQREIVPEEGMIILFPGWLKHGVRMNTTNHVRISLSFNIMFQS